ncbi:MAG: NAD-dependent epimerase/dehydratase family protein [Microthrixaceae bacterium]
MYGDGLQTRSYCYVEDLARGIVALLDSDVNEPVNLGNPVEHTVLYLAQTVSELVRVGLADRPPAAARARSHPASARHHAGHRAARLAADRVGSMTGSPRRSSTSVRSETPP